MYRKPPEDDEQPEEILVSYPRRRSRRAIPRRRLVNKYHPDENPAVPRIKRASLVEKQPTPPDHIHNGRQRSAHNKQRSLVPKGPIKDHIHNGRQRPAHKNDLQSRGYNRRALT